MANPRLIICSILMIAAASGCSTPPEVVPASPVAAPTPPPVKIINGCPEGFLSVGKNEKLGVKRDFCVMKFEAKKTPEGFAVSEPAQLPWTNVNQAIAKSMCANLGAGFDLITNAEWMTIANEIEKTPSNWSGGAVGAGFIYRGHSDSAPDSALDAPDVADGYSGTGNFPTNGAAQRRMHKLAKGGEIWDFSGNVWEWVNWSPTSAAGPTSCLKAWKEFPEAGCAELKSENYLPANPGGLDAAFYGAVYGLGKLQGGPGGGPARGGHWADGPNAGLYALSLYFNGNNSYSVVGFRCVYHP